MNRPLRVGVIGCGSVSQKYIPHVLSLNHPTPRAEIVILCDAVESRREEVRQRYGLTNFTTDYTEVLNDPDVDLVLVLTSMQQHGKITKEALAAGKHVLVEKPMSMSLEEAAEIVELARKSPGYLVCAPHVILSPTYKAMWRHIQRGDIGSVMTARGFYGWSGPTWGRWFYEPGGGPMFDLGVYNVTTLTGLIGPAKRITALSGIAIPNRVVDDRPMEVQTDDNAQLLLDFGDARFGVVTTGFTIQQYRVPGIEIYGSEGTIQMIEEDWAPRGYELWQNSEGCWKVYNDRGGWPWTDGVRHLIESIENQTPPLITPEHAYHVLEVMVKTMESGRTGRALPIESTFVPPVFEDGTTLGGKAHLVHDPGRS
jgi:predicted dehydrogenase